ncbi:MULTISPECIES: hypothetical protein [unclassified Campylobacter]
MTSKIENKDFYVKCRYCKRNFRKRFCKR